MRVAYLLIALLIIGFTACDTRMNIKDPSKSYFLKYFGGDGNQRAVALITNADGTLYILGNSRAADDSLQKIYLAKASTTGDVIWQRTFNESVETEARGFILTADQKLAVVANRYPSAVTSFVSLYFFDAGSGAKTSGVAIPSPTNTYSNTIIQTQDQGFLISGNTLGPDPQNPFKTDTLAWSFRMNNTLATPWNVTYNPGNNFDDAVRSFETSPGLFYIYGNSRVGYQGNLGQKYFGYSINDPNGLPAGLVSDSLTVFTTYSAYDRMTDAFTANGLLLTGSSVDGGGNVFLKVLKMRRADLAGTGNSDYEAQYSIRGPATQSPSLGKIPNTSSATPYVTGCASGQAGYYFLANTFSTATNRDIVLLKTDILLTLSAGFPITFGGVGDDTAAAVAELPDGHIMVLGTFQLGNPVNQYKIVLMKLNAQGKLQE